MRNILFMTLVMPIVVILYVLNIFGGEDGG